MNHSVRPFLKSLIVVCLLAGCTSTADIFDEFSLDDQPRPQNGEPERRGAVINEAAFNRTAMSATIAPYEGFVGSLLLDTGGVFEITPRIHANNSVDLNIVQSVSSPAAQLGKDNLTPTIATRDIASRILAQSGRTLLLGGLIQDRVEKSETGVPGVSRLPVVGKLFKQNTATAQRTELLVLITPRVVRGSSEIEGITRMLQGAQSQMKASSRPLISRLHSGMCCNFLLSCNVARSRQPDVRRRVG